MVTKSFSAALRNILHFKFGCLTLIKMNQRHLMICAFLDKQSQFDSLCVYLVLQHEL